MFIPAPIKIKTNLSRRTLRRRPTWITHVLHDPVHSRLQARVLGVVDGLAAAFDREAHLDQAADDRLVDDDFCSQRHIDRSMSRARA